MAANKTSLSAGSIIRDMLLQDPEVAKHTKKVFPVATDTAVLPYILYRRASIEQNPTKAGYPGADTVTIEVICYTEKYGDGVELAEAVRAALDGKQGEKDGLVMRSCVLTESEEGYDSDAYAQQLVFNIKI
jgi:hypothetical protein